VEAIRGLMRTREGSGRIQLPGLDIYRSFDWLRLAPVGFDSRLARDFEAELRIPGLTTLPERRLTIDIELMDVELVTKPSVYNKQMDALDWEKCAGSLKLRNWRPGDSYIPVGKSGAEKIKTLFQHNRIPLWERRTWPVVVRGESILWTRRFGVADVFAATPESRRLLLIREAPESNGMESKDIVTTSIESERARMKHRVSRGQGPDERGAEVL
jgi:tRNA(Ile)-lysidine synthase